MRTAFAKALLSLFILTVASTALSAATRFTAPAKTSKAAAAPSIARYSKGD